MVFISLYLTYFTQQPWLVLKNTTAHVPPHRDSDVITLVRAQELYLKKKKSLKKQTNKQTPDFSATLPCSEDGEALLCTVQRARPPLGVWGNWSRKSLTCWSSHSFLRWNQDTSGLLWSHSPQGKQQKQWMELWLMCRVLLTASCWFCLESTRDAGLLGAGTPLAVGSPKASAAYWVQSQKWEAYFLPSGRAGKTQHSLPHLRLPIFILINGFSEFTCLLPVTQS